MSSERKKIKGLKKNWNITLYRVETCLKPLVTGMCSLPTIKLVVVRVVWAIRGYSAANYDNRWNIVRRARPLLRRFSNRLLVFCRYVFMLYRGVCAIFGRVYALCDCVGARLLYNGFFFYVYINMLYMLILLLAPGCSIIALILIFGVQDPQFVLCNQQRVQLEI